MGMNTNNNGRGYSYTYPHKAIAMAKNFDGFNSTPSGSFGISSRSITRQARLSGVSNFQKVSDKHIVKVLNKPVIDTKVSSVVKQLQFIKSCFSLKDDDLAKVIKVSRSTIHTWRTKEDIPKDYNSKRVFKLFMLSNNWQDKGFSVNKNSLKMPIIEDESIFDMLISDNIDSHKILFCGNSLSMLLETDNNTDLF